MDRWIGAVGAGAVFVWAGCSNVLVPLLPKLPPFLASASPTEIIENAITMQANKLASRKLREANMEDPNSIDNPGAYRCRTSRLLEAIGNFATPFPAPRPDEEADVR